MLGSIIPINCHELVKNQHTWTPQSWHKKVERKVVYHPYCQSLDQKEHHGYQFTLDSVSTHARLYPCVKTRHVMNSCEKLSYKATKLSTRLYSRHIIYLIHLRFNCKLIGIWFFFNVTSVIWQGQVQYWLDKDVKYGAVKLH